MVVSFDDMGSLYLAFEAGEAEGVVTDLVGNQGYADDTGGAKVIESYATDELYGFAVQEEALRISSPSTSPLPSCRATAPTTPSTPSGSQAPEPDHTWSIR